MQDITEGNEGWWEVEIVQDIEEDNEGGEKWLWEVETAQDIQEDNQGCWEVENKGSGDTGKWLHREVVTRAVLTQGSGDTGKW